MANIPISKIKINDDILELKDASSRTNITALNSATTQNTTKITQIETAINNNTSSIELLTTKVNEIEENVHNSDHYNITVDSSSETLIFSK